MTNALTEAIKDCIAACNACATACGNCFATTRQRPDKPIQSFPFVTPRRSTMSRTAAVITTVLAFATASAFAHDPSMPATAASHAAASMQGSSMPMTGDADVDFATMMREHHQMALPMARTELRNGKDPAMRRMARHVIDAQTKEIAQFDRWLANHKASMKGSGK